MSSFLALTLSAASKLVDGLVTADLVARDSDPLDRRKIVLKLTASGHRKFAAVRQATADFLTERVSEVSLHERACITDAMRTLRGIFSEVPPPETNARLIKAAPAGLDN
ncbi:MAG: hypothetical protein WDN28_23610 [Chthoniobacter sp.]